MAIRKETYGADKNILIAPENALTFGCRVTNTGLNADSDGKKILKAGSPLYGDLQDRDTAFVLASESGDVGSEVSNAVAILLHDVDVTAGAENATIVVAGCVDLLKLDEATAELITDATVTALANIVFVKGADR